MLKNRLILCLVALLVSSGMTFVVYHQLPRALNTGMIAMVAALIGVTVADMATLYTLHDRIDTLKDHVRALQKRRAQVYQSMMAIAAERDRTAGSINSLQTQLRQLQIQSANLWQQKEELSWNLAGSPTPELPPELSQMESRLQVLQQQESDLNRSLAATLAAKQRGEAALDGLQKELDQLRQQIADQRSLQAQLEQDIPKLEEQKQQLGQDLSGLQAQVADLERYRTELNQFLQIAEPRRQQVETGSRSLQVAIEQLQEQITVLQSELGQLEHQIVDRRSQKDQLDQELANLKGQKTQLQVGSPAASEPAPANGRPEPKENGNRPTPVSAQLPLAKKPEPVKKASTRSNRDLPPEWTELMVRMPESEMQVLQVIARDENPAPAIKKIAEANLTMPELLIDAINERALDTVGDLILDTGNGTVAIAPEHVKAVKKLVQTYEYLTTE